MTEPAPGDPTSPTVGFGPYAPAGGPQPPLPNPQPPPGYPPLGPQSPPTYPPPNQGPPGYPPPAYPPGPAGLPGYQPGPPASGTNGFAVAALILGILGFFTLPIPLAVVFGFVALSQIRRTGQAGRGMAIAGIVLAGVWTVLVALLIIAGVIGSSVSVAPGAAAPTAPVPTPSGGTTPSDDPSSVDVNVIDVKVGDCISRMTGISKNVRLQVTPCTDPHEGEVFALFDATGVPYPGDPALSRQADDGCTDRLAGYAPTAADVPGLGISFVYPSAESWTAGRRQIQCIATSDPPATGSIRGR